MSSFVEKAEAVFELISEQQDVEFLSIVASVLKVNLLWERSDFYRITSILFFNLFLRVNE